MRRTLTIIGISLLALIAGLGVWGAMLPRDHSVTSRITVPAPPDSVYPVMRDFGALPTWWPDIESVTPVQRNDDWERWRQKSNGWEMTIIISEEESPFRLVTIIDTTDDASFGGRWTHVVKMAPGGGSTVTVTEDGWVGNPYFRVMLQLGSPYSTLDSYLSALGARFGATGPPAHVIP